MPTAASTVGATLVGVASAWLGLGSLSRFVRSGTTIDPSTPGGTTLITSGPNGITRNPMYLGLAGALAAYAIWRRSTLALIPAALLVLTLDRIQVPREEAVLRKRFGAEYERYVSSTPRWL